MRALSFPRIGLAGAWAAMVVDVVAETAAAPGAGINGFGVVLAEPGDTITIWVIAGLAGSAVGGLVLALTRTTHDRVERRVAADLDARFERLASESAAFTAQREKLAGRVAELHGRIESLTRERQAIEDQLSRQRNRLARLRDLTRRSLERLDTLRYMLDEAIPGTTPETEPDADGRGAAPATIGGEGHDAASREPVHDVDTVTRLPDVSTSEPDR
jgi:chaperonin cofactor prefoldin